MSIDDDFDCDALISRALLPHCRRSDRVAFHRAAEEALARVPCWGDGAVYRAVAATEREARPIKLKSADPLALAGDGRRVVQYRKREH